jgi:hypothetical protein
LSLQGPEFPPGFDDIRLEADGATKLEEALVLQFERYTGNHEFGIAKRL